MKFGPTNNCSMLIKEARPLWSDWDANSELNTEMCSYKNRYYPNYVSSDKVDDNPVDNFVDGHG